MAALPVGHKVGLEVANYVGTNGGCRASTVSAGKQGSPTSGSDTSLEQIHPDAAPLDSEP